MNTYLPQFDELNVISDIHIGGHKDQSRNFQAFNHGPRLSRFIDHLTTLQSDGNLALVLNGDIFDSLAEESVESYVALAPQTAVNMMRHLFEDASFADVWTSLSGFVTTPGRHLIFVGGNHDIELAFAIVQEAIRDHLAGNNLEARARINFSANGGGFACLVGHARVFCTHGNELDPWNWIDYTNLSQLTNAFNAGRRIDPAKWQPNAGTRLVVDVMNIIKERFPFVDLLKPEAAAFMGVLMALDWELFRQIDLKDILLVLKDKYWEGDQATKALLGHFEANADASIEEQDILAALLGPNLKEAVLGSATSDLLSEDALLLEAENAPESAFSAELDQQQEVLGGWDFISGRLGLLSPEEALRRALKDWLKDDRSFALQDKRDPLYKSMDERAADSVNFIITGHTHQPRAMDYRQGRYYFNCGTWMRRLRLTTEVLDDEDAFKERLWPALQSSQMDIIDQTKIPGPGGEDVSLVLDQTNAVRIAVQGDKVAGDLIRVTDARRGKIAITPEPGTKTFFV